MFYTYCSNKHARGEGNTEALLLRNPNQLEKQDIRASHSYLAHRAGDKREVVMKVSWKSWSRCGAMGDK